MTSVSPNSGPVAGGTAVTITGTNFATGATVTFGTCGGDQRGGGEQHDDHGDDASGQGGCGDGDGDRERAEREPGNGFTYVVPPTVSSVSPNSGSTAGGTAVTITGTNFASGATVTFGAAAATNVVVVSSTSITATTPAGTAGAVTVTVTWVAEREPGERIYLCGAADGEQCQPEQRSAAGGTGGDDHRDQLCLGSDSERSERGGDQRGGGEQHDDYGDDAGRKRGRGDGDGDGERVAEREPGEWVHLQRDGGDRFRPGGIGHAAIADGDGER